MSEKESYAGYYLKKHGLTRQALVQFLTKDAIQRQQVEQALGQAMGMPGQEEDPNEGINDDLLNRLGDVLESDDHEENQE